MERYIDADRIDWRLIIPTNPTAEENMIYQARKLVESQPTADVVDVVHGLWIEDGFGEITCSKCNFKFYPILFKFCPSCGAKMDTQRWR